MNEQEIYDDWMEKHNQWLIDVGLADKIKIGGEGWNNTDNDKISAYYNENPPPPHPKPPEPPEPPKLPKPRFKDFMSVMSAMIKGKYVSKERQLKRLEICHGCDEFNIEDGHPRCGVCGCKLDGDSRLVQLTAYEETEKYGCKHDEGSQWKKRGV